VLIHSLSVLDDYEGREDRDHCQRSQERGGGVRSRGCRGKRRDRQGCVRGALPRTSHWYQTRVAKNSAGPSDSMRTTASVASRVG
jgi:hypothetical protein